MARICIAQPMTETRALLAQLVARDGHEVVEPADGVEADVVVYEAGSVRCRRFAARLDPSTPLVALSAEPGTPVPGLKLPQPFSPADLRRVLDRALRPPAVA